ncbi:MAG TPA: hypothetical protein VHB02_05945 [Acidimicrobiales bacterium]|nr:hypothetical protein [Acidimicrobiales bacterium]
MDNTAPQTHLVAHSGPTHILIAEHSSDPDEYGYQLRDVERIPDTANSADEIISILVDAGYRVVTEAEYDELTASWAMGVARA